MQKVYWGVLSGETAVGIWEKGPGKRGKLAPKVVAKRLQPPRTADWCRYAGTSPNAARDPSWANHRQPEKQGVET